MFYIYSFSKVRHDISVRWEEKYVCVMLIVSLRELEGGGVGYDMISPYMNL